MHAHLSSLAAFSDLPIPRLIAVCLDVSLQGIVLESSLSLGITIRRLEALLEGDIRLRMATAYDGGSQIEVEDSCKAVRSHLRIQAASGTLQEGRSSV